MSVDLKPRPNEWLPAGHLSHDYVGDWRSGCLHEYSDGVCDRASYWAGHTKPCSWRRSDGSYGCGYLTGHPGKHSSE